jgi:hypothetical protein
MARPGAGRAVMLITAIQAAVPATEIQSEQAGSPADRGAGK